MFLDICFNLCSYQPLAAAISEVKRMKNLLSDMKQKINFLSGLSSAFEEQIHTDIQLKPGCNGPSIPAHRALLVSVFVVICVFCIQNNLICV